MTGAPGRPRPQAPAAWLVNGNGRATWHEYVRTDAGVTIPYAFRSGGRMTKELPCWHFVYRCTETGVERVWGYA